MGVHGRPRTPLRGVSRDAALILNPSCGIRPHPRTKGPLSPSDDQPRASSEVIAGEISNRFPRPAHRPCLAAPELLRLESRARRTHRGRASPI